MGAKLTLEDREAIRDLVSLYGHVVDAADWQGLDRVFAADAVWDATALGLERVNGIEAVRAWFAKTTHPLGHHTTNVMVNERDANSAEVLCKWVVVAPHGKSVTGEYRDIVVRTPAGWRIANRSPRRMKPRSSPGT